MLSSDFMSASTFAIKWKGVDLGEMSVAHIRQQLAEGNISRMHQVSTDEGWMSVDEFMRRVDGAEAEERQRRQEQRSIESRPLVGGPPRHESGGHTVPPAYSQPASRSDASHIDSSEDRVGPISEFFLKLLDCKKSTVWISLWMVIAAVLPFMIIPLVDSFNLGTDWIVRMLQGYFSLLIAGYVYRLSGASPSLLKKGLGFFLFTIAVGIPLLLQAQSTWPVLKQIYAGTLKDGLGNGILGFVIGVGPCEELCKALPLLIFCFGRGPLKTRDAVFLGMMSGLGFAFSEGAVYTFSSAADVVTINMGSTLETLKAATSEKQFASELEKLRPDLVRFNLYVLVMHLVRLISLPLLHGAWAGCVGWFIARANAVKSWHSIAIGILIVAVLHGMYDVIVAGFMGPGLASTILSLIIIIFSILLFAVHLFDHSGAQALPAEELSNPSSS